MKIYKTVILSCGETLSEDLFAEKSKAIKYLRNWLLQTGEDRGISLEEKVIIPIEGPYHITFINDRIKKSFPEVFIVKLETLDDLLDDFVGL